MNKRYLKDTLGWGLILWLIGYALGIALFAIVPPSMLGWVIMPVGALITLWILWKKIESRSFSQYVLIAITWTLTAIVCDYFFLVKLFKPADGYYKLDVYLYYALTLVLPMAVGWYKSKQQKTT